MADHKGSRAIDIKISSDRSVATLVLQLDALSLDLSVEMIMNLIREKGVIVREDVQQVVERAIERFKARPDMMEVEIARAVDPVHAKDGWIEWTPGCDPTPHPPSGSSANSTRVDYYNQTNYISVAANTQIAVIRPPVPGTDGHDVLGKPRKAKSGTAFQLKTDASVSVDEQGIVRAATDGILQFERNMLRVLPMFEIPGHVNFTTGNIFFKGCVVIRGDICDRFTVYAREDLTVMGLIGGATVICGRHLNAACGMAAHEHGCIFVGGNAQIGYFKNVHGLVQGDLLARRELINCDVAVGGNLIADAGAVVGGHVAVHGKALIGALGSPKATATTITFGSHPCQKQVEDLLKGDPTTSKMAEQRMSGHFTSIAERIRSCAQSSCELNSARPRPVDLTVTKFLHPGVVVRCGRTRVAIDKQMRGPIHIFGDQHGGLFYRMGDSVTHPLTELAHPMSRAG